MLVDPTRLGHATGPARTIDLTGVPGSRWTLISDLSTEQISEAIDEARRWFGNPNHYWFSEDGTTGPLASGMRNAEVHIEDEWPATRAVITFQHSHWPDGRLRRSIRVFDDAGRVSTNPYASIHLMEDLDTGHLPPPSQAHDGYLDV